MAIQRWLLIIFCVLSLSSLGLTGLVRAESPAAFLKSLSGTWRGSGSVYISDKSKNSPVRCKITSTLNEAKKRLSNKGRCATAQKKTRISGSIGYESSGNKLTGSYINAIGDFAVTSSSGSISGSRLTLYTSFQNQAVSKITRTRNVVTRVSKRKFIVVLYEKVGGSYKRRGSITFTK
jgi:hypothetical protein